MFYFAAFA